MESVSNNNKVHWPRALRPVDYIVRFYSLRRCLLAPGNRTYESTVLWRLQTLVCLIRIILKYILILCCLGRLPLVVNTLQASCWAAIMRVENVKSRNFLMCNEKLQFWETLRMTETNTDCFGVVALTGEHIMLRGDLELTQVVEEEVDRNLLVIESLNYLLYNYKIITQFYNKNNQICTLNRLSSWMINGGSWIGRWEMDCREMSCWSWEERCIVGDLPVWPCSGTWQPSLCLPSLSRCSRLHAPHCTQSCQSSPPVT